MLLSQTNPDTGKAPQATRHTCGVGQPRAGGPPQVTTGRGERHAAEASTVTTRAGSSTAHAARSVARTATLSLEK